jgi:hypothetical protein
MSLVASSGTYSLTGSDVDLIYTPAASLDAESGSYALTGTEVDLFLGREVAADAGSYAISGTEVNLNLGRTLDAESGSYTLTGTDVTFLYGYALAAESGSYAITGTAAGLLYNRAFDAESGSYSITGTDVTLTYVSFDWADYTDIVARYDFTDVSTVFAQDAADFDGIAALEIDSAAVTAYPCTFCCFFKTSNTGNDGTLMFVGDKDDTVEYLALRINSSDDVVATSRTSATTASAVLTGSFQDGSWHFGAAVFSGNTSRTAYCDSETPVEETTSVAITATFDRTSIGRLGDSTPTNYLNGEIAMAMVFSAALSSDEITYLYNSGNGRTFEELSTDGDSNNPGTANLEGCWHMRETNDTRLDETSNDYDLEEVAEPVVASFASANSEHLVSSTAARTALGFTMGIWFKSDDTGTANTLMCISDTDALADYALLQIETTNGFGARSKNGTANSASIASPGGDGFHDDNWHFGLGVFKADGTKVAYCDAQTPVTQSSTVSWTGNSDGTTIGALRTNSAVSQYMEGELAYAAIWNSELTAANHTWLYNSGSGRSLWELQNSDDSNNPGEPAHLWKLNEASGNRSDSVGSITLTDTNTVTNATDGVVFEPVLVTAGPVYFLAKTDDAVAKVEDQSGNDYHLTQATRTKRPLLVTVADGTGYAVKCDGVDDYMATAAFATDITQPDDIFVCFEVANADTGTQQDIFDGIDATDRQKLQLNTDPQFEMWAGSTIPDEAVPDTNLRNWLLAFAEGAGAGAIYRDGTPGYTGNNGTQELGGLTIASRYNLAQYAEATYRQLVVNDGAFTTSERNDIGNKIAVDQGITWNDLS